MDTNTDGGETVNLVLGLTGIEIDTDTAITLEHKLFARLTTEVVEAKDIIQALLNHAQVPHCADMHHAKRDRHEWDKPCPAVARAMQVRHRAQVFISANA